MKNTPDQIKYRVRLINDTSYAVYASAVKIIDHATVFYKDRYWDHGGFRDRRICRIVPNNHIQEVLIEE